MNTVRFLAGWLFAAFAFSIALAVDKPLTIVLVGDSTVSESSGWGPGFRRFVGEGVKVENIAQNGRSSKSFRDEGHWDRALALKGDYYLIQFGHNDQPGKGPKRETDPATTYADNLRRYVDDVRAQGGHPVLVTSLTRRNFSKTEPKKIVSTLGPYADAVMRVAEEKKVPVIDLHTLSLAYCEMMGPAACAKLNPMKPDGTPDTTHLLVGGSELFGQLVAAELRNVVPELATRVLSDSVGKATQFHDLEYGKAGGESLKLDVSAPDGSGPRPVVILVHGGGWGSGDKGGSDKPGNGADITPWFAPLTEARFAWVSINYRLSPPHRWPACFEDVHAAIRWVKKHAHEFNGDPTKIAIVGHSAGGHLALLAAMLPEKDTAVQAVVGFAPVTDFIYELPARGGLGTALQNLHNQPKEPNETSLAILRETAPINHVKPGLPPFLLVHGDADKSVPYQTSLNLQKKLRETGVTCDLITVKGAPHGLLKWNEFHPGYEQEWTAWLEKTLGGK